MSKMPTYHVAITRRADGGRATIEVGDYAELQAALSDITAQAAEVGWLAEIPARQRGAGHPGGTNALPRRRTTPAKEVP